MNTLKRAAFLLQTSHYTNKELSDKLKIKEARIEKLITGASPSITEISAIGKFFGVSVQLLINAEVNVVDTNSYPLVLSVEAGDFIHNYSDQEYLNGLESYNIPGFSGEGIMLFNVSGDSMMPAISSDDYLICQHIQDPGEWLDGTIVVLIVHDSVVVKRIFKENGSWILQSESPTVEAITVKQHQIKAMWKVVGKVTKEFLKSSKENFHRIENLHMQLQELRNELLECHKSFVEVSRNFKK